MLNVAVAMQHIHIALLLNSFMAPLQHHTSSDKTDSTAKPGILDFT